MLNDDNYLNYLGKFFSERQVEKIDPLLDWLKSEFGFKPVVYSSFFGGKQEEGLVKAVEDLLKKTDNCELASIDAIASAAHSLVIAIGIFRGKLNIEEAIELIRLEEDLQVLFFFLFCFSNASLFFFLSLAQTHTPQQHCMLARHLFLKHYLRHFGIFLVVLICCSDAEVLPC